MSANKMVNRFRRQMDLFYRCLAKTRITLTMENIHRLRVAIKNLRSLLVLLDKACGGALKKKDHLKIYAPLFRLAGQVRDIQISLGLLKSNSASYLVPYKKYMGQKLRLKLRLLQAETQAIDLSRLDKLNAALVKNLEVLHPGSMPERTDALISHVLRRVHALSLKPRDLKTLHDIRILLKTVQENLGILLRIKPSPGWRSMDKKLSPLYNALGKWHDEALLIKSIKAFLLKAGPGKVYLERLGNRLKKKNKTREDKIYKLLHRIPSR